MENHANDNGSKKRSFRDFDATNDFLASMMGEENPACLKAARDAVDTSGDADFLASMTFASGNACPCCVGAMASTTSTPPPKRTKKKQAGRTLLAKASSGKMSLWEWSLQPSWEEEETSEENNWHQILWIRQLPLGWELSWKTSNGPQQWMPLPHWNEGGAFLLPKSDDANLLGFRIAPTTEDPKPDNNEPEEAILYVCRFSPTLIATPSDESDELELSWDNTALQVAREAVPLFRNENPNSKHPPYQRLVGHLGEMVALGLDLVDQG